MSDKANEEFFKLILITNKKRKCGKPAATAAPTKKPAATAVPTNKTATTAAPTPAPGEKLNSTQKGNFSRESSDDKVTVTNFSKEGRRPTGNHLYVVSPTVTLQKFFHETV